MPDALKCPRCGRNVPDYTDYLLYESGWPDEADKFVYVCPCGPLCVVEGERATWYAPMAETSDLLKRACRALYDETTMDDTIAAIVAIYPEVRP